MKAEDARSDGGGAEQCRRRGRGGRERGGERERKGGGEGEERTDTAFPDVNLHLLPRQS